MNITTSYELVIIPATISIPMVVQEPDIGAKNIAITVPISMSFTLIDPVVVAKKNVTLALSVLDIPGTIPTPDVYANTFSNPSPLNIGVSLLQPTIYTQTIIKLDPPNGSEFSIPMTLETPNYVVANNFSPTNYGTVFERWNAESTPYTANSAGQWSTANAGYPGEEISYWHGDYATPGTRTFLDPVYDYVRLRSKVITNAYGVATAKYALFNGATNMDGSLTAGTTLGSFMNNRTAITIVMVVEPFQSAIGTNRFLLHFFNSGANSRFQLGLYYPTVTTASLYGSASRNGSGVSSFTIGTLNTDERVIIMVSCNFVAGWIGGYINNSRVYYNNSATFGGGSGNTDSVDSNKILMGALWSSGGGAPIYQYYGNIYQSIWYYDTALDDNNREQIFRSLGAYYGITQQSRNY